MTQEQKAFLAVFISNIQMAQAVAQQHLRFDPNFSNKDLQEIFKKVNQCYNTIDKEVDMEEIKDWLLDNNEELKNLMMDFYQKAFYDKKK